MRTGKILFMLITVHLLFLNILSAEEKPAPIRGIWVVRHTLKSAESIEALLKFAEMYEFTDLFVQVRGRGDSYYHSRYEPLAEELDPSFDPLGYLMAKTQNHKLRIHAWINVFYFWSAKELPKSEQHVLYQKPEWIVYPAYYDSTQEDSLMSNRRNGEGLYHSPLLSEVRKYLINIVDDILSQYAVAGLHLDYIRYPDDKFDFNPVARESFKEKYFLDPLEFKKNPELFVQNYGETGYEIFFQRWGAFLRQGLSEFVDSLSMHVRANYPGIILSAAVKPDLEKAHWQYYQEWDRWISKGWLDWAIPMNYTPDDDKFLLRVRRMLKTTDMEKLLIGVSLYNQPPDAAIHKIKIVEDLDLPGYVLFSYDSLIHDAELQKRYREIISKPKQKQ